MREIIIVWSYVANQMTFLKLVFIASFVVYFSHDASVGFAKAEESPTPTPIEYLQNSVVQVEVHGFDQKSNPITIAGTGFFVSKEGYLVTAKHLIEDIVSKGATRESLTYSVNMDPNGTPVTVPAINFWTNQISDLLVLSVKTGNIKFRVLTRNATPRGDIKIGETQIFTGGFPENYPFIMDSGIVKSFAGPSIGSGPLWVTNMSFKHGQSGSPVILKDGSVVAVVTAIDQDASTIGFITPTRIIPVNFWDIAH